MFANIGSSFSSHKSFSSVQNKTKSRRNRLVFLSILACCWCCLIVSRLFFLQISKNYDWVTKANKQHQSGRKIAVERGMIVDRNSKPLAKSVPSGSVFIRPSLVKNKAEVASKLTKTLSLSESYVNKKLNSKSPFVWIKRQIPKIKAEEIRALKISGVDYLIESRRYYPYKEAASTLLGRVGIDGDGRTGVELIYDRQLRGEDTKSYYGRDALGNKIYSKISDDFQVPQGSSLQLTLDIDLQRIVDQELQKGVADSNSKLGLAAMIDAETGEVLAMSQSEVLNYNKAVPSGANLFSNKLAEMVFEPGSIMKPLVTAAAFELGKIKPGEVIDCENGRLKFGRRLIKDVHPEGRITVEDIIIRSSNVGMSKIGMRLGSDNLYMILKEFGFGEKTNLSLPGETRGILRPVSAWSKIDVATHSFGQGVAVTALQVLASYATFVNGGELHPLSLLAGKPKESSKQVISPETAKRMRDILVRVVEEPEGTGNNAIIPGVMVGGKTGTAQKARVDGRGYQANAYVASFIGFADPAEVGLDRKLVLLVTMDEPRKSSIYGGVVAAPVFKRIIERSVKTLVRRKYLKNWQKPSSVEVNKPSIRLVNFS